jgi:hypothetical protein
VCAFDGARNVGARAKLARGMTLGYEFGGVKAAEELDEREAKDMLKRRTDCGSEVGTRKSKKPPTWT